MNAFVRDGAVNRKRRARQSLCTRNTEPERKRIHKTDYCYEATPAPRDVGSSILQIRSGESSVNQSTVVATDKESRYSNIEFMRAKAFLFLNYKKINSFILNKNFKEYIKRFDEHESRLKRIFEKCYDVTGSVEKSKVMMKQLATNTCSRLDITPNVSSGVINRRLSTLPYTVVEKTDKLLKKNKDKKSMTIRLKEKIDKKNLKLFGKEHSTKDKKIIYTKKIDKYNVASKIDYNSDTTIISDDEEGGSCMRLTKAFSLHDTKINSFKVTQLTKPKTGIIVRINSNICPQLYKSCAKQSILATTQLKTSVHKKFKKGPKVCDTINSQISASNMNNLEEMINPQLNTDSSVQNAEGFALEKVNAIGRNTVSQFKIDRIVKNSKVPALESNIDGDNTVPQLKINDCVQNVVLVQNINDREMTVSPLIIDEYVQNDNSTALETDVIEIMDPKLITDVFVQNANSTELETNIDGNNTVPLLKMNECGKNSEDSILDQNIDDEDMTVPLVIDECIQNSDSTTLETNFLVEKIIDLEIEKSTSTQNLVNSQINALKIDADIDDSKEQSKKLNHANIELKIRKIINTDDKVFQNSIIKDLATYFLNDDFLSKVDALWKTTESELVGELIINLLNMFNDTEYNMATFTGCLICIFREIAQKSSIVPCQLKLKLIVFLDAIKKYIKYHDNALWRTWFLPSMFFDWCFIVAFIFMNTKNEFKIDLNNSVVKNASAYYKMVKQCRYLFINQDLKPSKPHKKSGIFELTRIDDLLEIDEIHATNVTKVIPNISINTPSNELERKKFKTDDNCINTINHTTPENIDKVCPAPVYHKIPKIIVRPEFSYSKSFVNKLNWFNGNASELQKKFNVLTSNKSIESSTVKNNTTVVGNNKVPSSVNKRRSVITSSSNKPTKSKKSKTQIEPPRVFFTIANNPREFEISYGSSAITQKSSSLAVSKNVNSSSTVPTNPSSPATVPTNPSSPATVPTNPSSSATVPQSLSPSRISQMLSPYYNHFSSSNTSSQTPGTLQTMVTRNLSMYYNNITSNITQAPMGLQTRPSISNTTQSSNATNTNTPVDINITSILHPYHASNQLGIHHQYSAATNSQLPKAASTWPSNLYNNMCSDPSCSKSSTYHTQYTNSVPSYSQSLYNYNFTSVTSHTQHSNALTYPTTYTHPIMRDLSASDTAMVPSMNTYMQQQNYNFRNSYSSQNNLQTPDHNTQVSPDLPDARLPNMPNHQNADTINKRCMAANCSNTSCFSCNTCLAAFYCSIQCQKSDWHYHQNKCCVSF